MMINNFSSVTCISLQHFSLKNATPIIINYAWSTLMKVTIIRWYIFRLNWNPPSCFLFVSLQATDVKHLLVRIFIWRKAWSSLWAWWASGVTVVTGQEKWEDVWLPSSRHFEAVTAWAWLLPIVVVVVRFYAVGRWLGFAD